MTDVRVAAMDFLARREHSGQELQEKLLRRFPESLVVSVIKELQKENLQSDRRFAEAFVRQRSQRGYGPIRIKQELRQKGISDSDIHSGFEENDVNWYSLLSDLIQRKYGETEPADLKEKAKRQRFLLYRGFSSDQVRDLLS